MKTRSRRIGWMGWTIAALALVAAAAFGIWRYALANNSVALLDGIDRIVGGTDGTRIAASRIAYGADPAQTLEVIVPAAAAAAPRPVIVFIHGGGWNSGAPGNYHFAGRALARLGYVTVLAGYRLKDAGKFPRMLEDSAAVVRWTADNIAAQGGDPARVYLMGHSAGAYNALMLTLDRQWLGRQGLPDDFIKGTVSLAGPADFYPFTTDSARAAFGAAPDPAATQPVNFARGDAPPILLLTGDADTTVKPRNSIALAAALTRAGQPEQAELLKGVSHAGIIMQLAQPFARDTRTINAAAAFLTQHGGAASAPVQARGG